MAQYSIPSSVKSELVKIASPLLFGPLFNWALYGILCVQIYVYSYNFPNDKWPLKSLAYFIFLLETVQTALTGADVYYWFIDGYGNPEQFLHSHFVFMDMTFMTTIGSFVVQGYFCYRIWVLNSRSSWFCLIIVIASVTQAAAGMWLTIKALVAGQFQVSHSAKTALYLWSVPCALADIMIAVAMTLLLRRASGNFSNFVLIRVVRLTIETNALTAALAIIALALFVALPNEYYYIYPAAVIGKVYSNTLLVSLNNRIYFRDNQSLGHTEIASSSVSDRAHTIAVSSPRFAVPESQQRVSKGNTLPVYSISRPVDTNSSNDNDTNSDSSLRHSGTTHVPPEDLEWAVGMPPSPHPLETQGQCT